MLQYSVMLRESVGQRSCQALVSYQREVSSFSYAASPQKRPVASTCGRGAGAIGAIGAAGAAGATGAGLGEQNSGGKRAVRA